MPTANKPKSPPEHRDLSPEEIQQTFQQLGLDDPQTRERLLRLAAAAEEQPTVGSWTNADSGSGYLNQR